MIFSKMERSGLMYAILDDVHWYTLAVKITLSHVAVACHTFSRCTRSSGSFSSSTAVRPNMGAAARRCRRTKGEF